MIGMKKDLALNNLQRLIFIKPNQQANLRLRLNNRVQTPSIPFPTR